LTVDPNDGQQLECNNCSVAEGVIRRDIVDDSADFVSRCASTFFQQVSFVCPHLETTGWRQGPSCAFGGTALLAVITANGLWSPVTTSSLYEPPWSFAEYLTESGAVHNNANILAARDGTTLPDGLRASTSGLDLGVVTKTRFDMGGCASGTSSPRLPDGPSDGQQLDCAILLGCTRCDKGGVVHDSEDILARCATTTPEGNLSASTSDLVSGTATGLSNAFGCASESRLRESAVDPSDCQQGWQQSRTLILVGLRFRRLSP